MPEPEALLRALRARGAPPPPGLEWHDTLASTNDRLKDLARAGAPEGFVVLADQQTGGRGRVGRTWSSPPGGLYLSVLLRPRQGPVTLLPLAAGLAVADAAREAGVVARLKWPNDVLVDDRKLAGVLAEGVSGSASLDWLVLGIGVNVRPALAQLPEEIREAAAWLGEGSSAPALAELAAAVLASLRVWYDAVASSPKDVVGEWRRRAVPWWGQPVDIRTAEGGFTGRLLDVDAEGALLVAADGETRRVLSGELLGLRRAG